MIKANTIIVSDWHLGMGVEQKNKIKRFLDDIINKKIWGEKLILNGDIFDLNWMPLEKILKKYKKILTKLITINQQGMEIVYILGNHDPLTDKQQKSVYDFFNDLGLNSISIATGYELRLNGTIYKITHGHHFDLIMEEHPLLSKLSDLPYHFLIQVDRLLGIGLTQIAIKFARRFYDWSRYVEKRCRWYLSRKPYKGIIVGHTHIPKYITWRFKKRKKIPLTKKLKIYFELNKAPINFDEKEYINSGDWVEKIHCNFITVSENGKVQLHYYR